MTRDQALGWLGKVNGSIQVRQSIEGASTVEEAFQMRELSFVTITVGADTLRAVFGSPMVNRALLDVFMVEYFISTFGDQGHPV